MLYIPKFTEEKQRSKLHALINEKPLGTWTTVVKGEITINHIPFLLHQHRGELGTLVGHVARSNSIWQDIGVDVESVVVFQGDQAYISPSWYPSKHPHGKAVPTWNYVVVHAHGMPKVIDDPDYLLQHVNELTSRHESRQAVPWSVADAPEQYIEKLLGAIVGIEIPIAKLVGKWKLGQNRPVSDQMGMIDGLMSRDDACSQALADQISLQVDVKNK